MKKIIRYLALTVVIFFILSLYSHALFKVARGEQVGVFTKPLRQVAAFPGLINKTFREVLTEKNTLQAIDEDFKTINLLEDDLWVLRSQMAEERNREVVLQNLRNDNISKKWLIQGPFESHYRIFNPIMMTNGDLIYNFNAKTGLKRMNLKSEVVWESDENLVAHHSLNIDHEGNVWACATQHEKGKIKTLSFTAKNELTPIKYRDDLFVKWDANTGAVLFQKSLTTLMMDHNLQHLLFQRSSSPVDPFHLNDVEPVLKDTGFFKTGDLLLSIKNSHSIIHYRPSNDSIVKFIQGPFAYQHDVDLWDGHTLSIFNNNMYSGYKRRNPNPKVFNTKDSVVFHIGNSNMLLYDYSTGTFSSPLEDVFSQNEICSKTEGLSTRLNDDLILIEEQNEGLLWVVSGSKVLYKNVFESYMKGYKEHLNWTRVIE